MPRRRKAARAYTAPRNVAAKLARVTRWDPVDPGEYPAEFQTAEERAAFDAEISRRLSEERTARDIVLRERLLEWPAGSWGVVFAERPEWEETELTEEQRGRWQAWREEAARRRKLETRSNILPMTAN